MHSMSHSENSYAAMTSVSMLQVYVVSKTTDLMRQTQRVHLGMCQIKLTESKMLATCSRYSTPVKTLLLNVWYCKADSTAQNSNYADHVKKPTGFGGKTGLRSHTSAWSLTKARSMYFFSRNTAWSSCSRRALKHHENMAAVIWRLAQLKATHSMPQMSLTHCIAKDGT